MNSLTGQIGARRWLFVALAIAMVAVIACGTETTSGAAPGGDRPDDSVATVETASANETDDDGETGDAVAATGGIDQECVNRVLGRAASGFGDVTSAERDRIFSECSGDDDGIERPPRLGDRTNRDFQFDGGALSAISPECVQDIISGADGGFAQITPEQRQQIFAECGPIDGEGNFGVEGFSFGGAGGPTGELPECFAEALGDRPGGIDSLSREDLQTITAACADETGSFGIFGGSGRGGDFVPRRGGAGGILDLTSDCVTHELGRSVDSFEDIAPDERQQLFQICGGG